jgi:formate dehydrogenase major subunit
VQGAFALTIAGRGFESRVVAGMNDTFLVLDCVSCGACVAACLTATLTEKSIIEIGTPERCVITTCAFCGVGCSFKVEMRGDEPVRMTPCKHAKANRGHSCVKGRFAYGYAAHSDRIVKPMIRNFVEDPWLEVNGTRRSASPPTACARSGTCMASGRSVRSRRRAAPTRRPIWCKS